MTISPLTLKLTAKGRRKGLELQWQDLVNGEAELAAALRASLTLLGEGRWSPGPKARR